MNYCITFKTTFDNSVKIDGKKKKSKIKHISVDEYHTHDMIECEHILRDVLDVPPHELTLDEVIESFDGLCSKQESQDVYDQIKEYYNSHLAVFQYILTALNDMTEEGQICYDLPMTFFDKSAGFIDGSIKIECK